MDNKKDIKSKELNDDQLNEVAGGRGIVYSKKNVTTESAGASTDSFDNVSTNSLNASQQKKKSKEEEKAFNVKTIK